MIERLLRNVLATAVLVSFLASGLLAQTPPAESELDDLSFPKLELSPEIFNLHDEAFTRVAERIQAGTASMQERRWFYRASERYAPYTTTPPSDWKIQADKAGKKIASSGPIYRWSSIGPRGDYDVTHQWGPPGARTQGRATALWAANRSVIFLGTADGGLWKTTDGGQNWTPLTDFQPSLSVGSVDVLPGSDLTNYSDATIYLATGEGNFSVSDKDGVGVLKSTDGGANWTVQPIAFASDAISAGAHRIRRIRIDRSIAGGQSVWAAADGGVYHTANGGTTWSLVQSLPYSAAPSSAAYPGGCWNEFATDFAVGPQNVLTGKATLFAVFGRYASAACVTPGSDARKNNGIYRSIDGGLTWTKISISGQNGFPSIATPDGDVGRIAILPAPSNPKHMYVLIARADLTNAAASYQALGVYDTLDATANPVVWTAENTSTNFVSSQGWYDMTGSVDPTNENRIMVGGLDNYISSNRGKTLTVKSGWSAGDTTWSHADHHHALWIDATTYLDANDGGLNIGTIGADNSVTWTNANIGGLATLQFYGMGQSATDPYRINAGLQDNGHALLDGGTWIASYGGDGGFAATDQDNDRNAFEEYVYGAIRKSDDGGHTWPDTSCMQAFGACTGCLGQCVPDRHTAFIANFILDVNNQNVMYVGTNALYRNTSAKTAGKVWERIGPIGGVAGDFVNNSTASNAYVSIVHTAKAGGIGDSLAPYSKVIYLGTSTGRVWKTTDAGKTWTDLTKAPLPVLTTTTGRFVTWIDTDPTNANNVIVTYSGWNPSTPLTTGHVFRSTDGGATWSDISGALPDEPFNSVAVNPNAGENKEAYVASDSGVYVNTDVWNTTSWLRINSGLLPHVSVNMLQFTNATSPRRLRAATHGRGIWEMERGTGAVISLDKSTYGCSDTISIVVQDSNRGAGSVTVTVSSTAEGGENVVLAEFPANSGHFAGTLPLTGSAAVNGDGRLTVFNADVITARYKRKASGPAYVNTFVATAATSCDACSGSTATGANIRVDTSVPVQSIEGGDHDEFLDNCETGRVDFVVKNAGTGSLTNVRISRVTASNPAVRVSTMPIAASLAQCATSPVTYRFVAAGLSPGETLALRIEVTSDELQARGITRAVDVTFRNTQSDYVFRTSKTYTFETGNEGWQAVQGWFLRQTTGGGANLSTTYMASSSLTSGVCDEVRSPIVKLTPLSTMSLYNQFATEPMSDAWYDRANVAVFDVAAARRTPIIPSGGRPYLASGPNGVCIVAGQPGFAGPGPGWLASTWTASDLQLTDGRPVQIDIGYGTDSTASLLGFWFDDVTLTNFYEQVGDQQTSCPTP